jgi:hypothetical protein
MIIRNINELSAIFVTKLMAFNLLQKFHKEEALAGVVTAIAQCVKGTILNWAPYFLNLFLEDYKYAHDTGKEFH